MEKRQLRTQSVPTAPVAGADSWRNTRLSRSVYAGKTSGCVPGQPFWRAEALQAFLSTICCGQADYVFRRTEDVHRNDDGGFRGGSKERCEELMRILEKVFCERCGMSCRDSDDTDERA